MQPLPELTYDAACALNPGQRAYQEDAVIADFPVGETLGFAVLADGMGGHAAGDIASKIIVTEVYSELKLQSGNRNEFEANIRDILTEAARAANQCIAGHVENNPATSGMGATLVAPVVLGDRLFWISVGDSPLFLFREGAIHQLNEDHSMAPQIDFMIENGLIGAESGRNHPDRNCLTSVLFGREIARIDCPQAPMALRPGDIVLAASDGVQTLSNDEISAVLRSCAGMTSAQIAKCLLAAVNERDDPQQDNVAFSVIQITASGQQGQRQPRRKSKASKPAEQVTEMLERTHTGMLKPVAMTPARALHLLAAKFFKTGNVA